MMWIDVQKCEKQAIFVIADLYMQSKCGYWHYWNIFKSMRMPEIWSNVYVDPKYFSQYWHSQIIPNNAKILFQAPWNFTVVVAVGEAVRGEEEGEPITSKV